MNTVLTFKDIKITFLDTLDLLMDGGVLFGPVPKAVWNRKYPVNNSNQIPQVADPILIQYRDINYLVDSSHGTSKMTAKAKRNAGLNMESKLETSLQEAGLQLTDIDVVIQTHMHNDHAGGLTKLDNGELKSTFSNARILINEIEWDQVRHPNDRTKGTYLKDNWQPVERQVKTWSESIELNDAMTLHHTGGHSKGHSILLIKQGDDCLIHMADLLLTHAHLNPLWVPAVDDYPMDSIEAKKKWLKEAFENNYKFIFYHNPFYAMIQFDREGKEIVDALKRNKEALVPYDQDHLIT